MLATFFQFGSVPLSAWFCSIWCSTIILHVKYFGRALTRLCLIFSDIVKFQIYMFVMEHLIMEDTVYLYNRNLNKVVHLHIMILKLASIICIEI